MLAARVANEAIECSLAPVSGRYLRYFAQSDQRRVLRMNNEIANAARKINAP